MAGGLSLAGLIILLVLAPLAVCACGMLRGARDEMEHLGLIGYGQDQRARHVRGAEDVQ